VNDGARKVTVAISDDFLTAFSKIPRKQQGKVIEFINKFRANPTSSGINYEKIKQAKDSNLRSVRIDQNYRGIALSPESGSVYVLLWVDHHDKAYQWAANKLCNIHPETGSLQVINMEEIQQQKPKQADGKKSGLFAGFRDRNLTALGIPEMLLPLVRSIEADDDLDKVAEYFPQEASEALYLLAMGYSLEEVHLELERVEKPKPVDTHDFETALDKPDSKRRFYVVEDEHELQEMLHAPLEKWRVFPHPSQLKLYENNWKGPVRVLGGAGTGKTVVAMHRAKRLATNVFTNDNDKILFTTFTRNLSADIRENLKKICSGEAMKRIEVVNLDKWVSEFLRRNGYDKKIVYGHKTKQLWENALTLAPSDLDFGQSFYREEWDSVIQPQSIETLDEYKKASRVGRGVRLNRKAREAVWPVFEEYRLLLTDAGLSEGADAMRDARHILEKKEVPLPYKAVVVDEAQDMGFQAFKLIRSMLPADSENPSLFIVGDAHQRIYKHKVVLSHCGINIRGRGRRLKINYRTTEETRRWAVDLLEGVTVDDLDGGLDERKGYRSLLHGIEPQLIQYGSFKEEVEGIAKYLQQVKRDDGVLNGTCLAVRTNELLEEYESAFTSMDIPTYRVKRTEAEDRKVPGLRLATMHRVKGLEFDRIIIAAVNDRVVPLTNGWTHSDDPVVKRDSENHERSLLYVAATRAKKEVLVTSFGKVSRFITG
jgi:mRNA-degrading endonuclease RelE of RelBE toxin-antitoxin system